MQPLQCTLHLGRRISKTACSNPTAGMLSGTTSTVNIQDLLFRGKRLHGYHLRDYWGSLDSKGQADLMQVIAQTIKFRGYSTLG